MQVSTVMSWEKNYLIEIEAMYKIGMCSNSLEIKNI